MAEDIAVLGFEVDTSDIKQARDELGRFEAQGRKVETSATRMERLVTRAFQAIGGTMNNLLAKIDSGTKAWAVYEVATAAATGSLTKMGAALTTNSGELLKNENQANRTTKALGLLKTALAALGITIGLSQLSQYSDTYGSLRGQIAFVTSSSQELNKTWRDLYMVSQQTAQSLKGTVELYARLGRSSKELQLTQTELVGITDTINKTLLISRTPAASAEAALFQLSQAMASGVLRGEELNSVMEQAPRLSQALADGLGVSVGQLRKMGAEGELTAKRVVGALQQQKDYIDKEFAGVFVSVSNAMARVDNVMINLVGRADEAAGASAVFGKAIADVITRLESGEAINSSTKALEFLTVGLSIASKALIFFLDHLDVFVALWASGKVVAGILSLTSAMKAYQVGSAAAAATTTALGLSLGTAGKAAAGFGAAIALTNPLGALISLVSAAAAAYLLFSTSATSAQEAETEFNKTLMDTGKNAQEYLGHLKGLNEAKREGLAIKYTEELEKERDALKEVAGDLRGELDSIAKNPNQVSLGVETDFDPAFFERLDKAKKALEDFQKGSIDSSQYVTTIREVGTAAGYTGERLDTLVAESVKLANQMQDGSDRARNYEARIALIKNPTDRAAQATLGLINQMGANGDALAAQSEEWGKYIGKLIGARDTIGMTKSEEVAYEAARKGFAADRVAYAVAISKQVEALGKYEKALQDGKTAEAEAAKESAMKLALLEASAVRAMTTAEQMANLGTLVARGILTQIEAARMAAAAGEQAYSDSLAAAQSRIQSQLALIGTNTKPTEKKDGESEAEKQAKALESYIEDQELAIKSAERLAEAYAKGEEAVRSVTQELEAEKQALKTGADSRTKVLALIQRENDARDRQDIAQQTAQLRQETTEQQKYAKALLSGTQAVKAYNVEKQVSAALAGKNAAAVTAEVEALRAAAVANQAAEDRVKTAQDLLALVESTATAQEKYNKQVAELERMSAEAKTPEQVRAVQRALADAKKELIDAQNELDPMAQKFASIAGEIEDGFKESFVTSFTEGENAFKKMTDGIRSMFKRLLAELAYQAMVKPILMPILQGVGTGMFGLSTGSTSQILQSVLGSVTGTAGGTGAVIDTGSTTNSGWLGQLLSSFGSRNSGSVTTSASGSVWDSLGSLFGSGGGSASGGGAGGMMSSLFSPGNLWNLGKSFFSGGGFSSGLSGIADSIYNGLTSAFGGNSIGQGLAGIGGWLSGTSSMQGATAVGGNLSGGLLSNAGTISNLGYMGYGLAGNFIGDWVGGGKYSGTLGSIGSVGGAALGASSAAMGATFGSFAGPIGALAGAVIGGLIGSVFGGGKKLKSQGIEVSLEGDELDSARRYEVWEKRKSFGRKKKKTYWYELSDEFKDDLNEQLGTVGDYIRGVGDVVGMGDVFGERFSTVKDTYKGSADGFTEWMEGYVDQLMQAAAPNLDDYKLKDETTAEAFQRLEGVLRSYAEIQGTEKSNIAKQVEALDNALEQTRIAFEAIAAPAEKVAELEETRANYLAKLAGEMETAAKFASGLTLAEQRDLQVQEYDKQAKITREDAELVGADMDIIEAGLAAERQALIDQYDAKIRSIDKGLEVRELTLAGRDRDAAVEKLREQQKAEQEAAEAAGYTTEQLSRLAAVLEGEFAEAVKQMDDDITRMRITGNKSVEQRIANATGNANEMFMSNLSSFDYEASLEVADATEAGLNVDALKKALELERAKMIEDYYKSTYEANYQNELAIKSSKGGSLIDRLGVTLADFDKSANEQIAEAEKAGLNMDLVREVLQIQRDAIIEETAKAIHQVNRDLRMRELNLEADDNPRGTMLERMEIQRQMEMEAAEAAGYSADQLERLAAVLEGELADAIAALDKQVADKNLDIAARLAKAEGRDLEAALMIFDERAKQEMADAEAIGADIVTLEKVLGLERLQVIEDFNRQALEQQKALATNYREWLDSQKLGATSTLTPEERLAEAQRQFSDQLDKARGGDVDAQGSMTQYAEQLLQISRDYYASSDEYAQLESWVRSTIENLGKQLELPGFAVGTMHAPSGLAWVGEEGPELVDFRGGERVYTAQDSAAMVSGSAAVDMQPVVKAVVVAGAEQTQLLAQLLTVVEEQAQELVNLRREIRRQGDKPT